MNIEIKNLFQTPQHVKLVSEWIYNEFWTDKPGYSPAYFENLLNDAKTENQIPLCLVAFYNNMPVGTVNLIENDDAARTHLKPWLAALVVMPEYRKKGIGAMLVKQLNLRAKKLYFNKLYLGTDNPIFYEKLGATRFEHVKNNFYIMCFDLTSDF